MTFLRSVIYTISFWNERIPNVKLSDSAESFYGLQPVPYLGACRSLWSMFLYTTPVILWFSSSTVFLQSNKYWPTYCCLAWVAAYVQLPFKAEHFGFCSPCWQTGYGR